MKKVIYIKANPKGDSESRTFQLSDLFLDEYKKNNSQDEITILDLYENNVSHLNNQMVQDIFTEKDSIMRKYSNQFAGADKYIIAAPMWNLSIPSILKAYIDHIVIAGITFDYTENGPVGLLAGKGKKAIHITSRGGVYTDEPFASFEMGDSYLRKILNFLGITEIDTIALEGTNMYPEKELDAEISKTKEETKRLAKLF